MEQNVIRWIPVFGVAAALGLLAIAAYQYSDNVRWTRVTVSLLCAPGLPDGTPNAGRGLSITALLLLCASMSLLFELISRAADTRGQRKTIQIAGIGSMVYALLTATPMHNLMVNIALAFLLVAMVAIVHLLLRRRQFLLAFGGIGCIALKLGSVSLYYTNTYTDIWGVLQKLSFILTTTWLIAVHFTPNPNTRRDGGGTEAEVTPATR